MPRSSRVAALLAATALVSAGCSTPGPPELSVYADGETIELAPVKYCDVRVRECSTPARASRLNLRPGRPVQISVPTSVADTPWVVSVWSTEGGEEPLQEFFGPEKAFAYTARPRGPRDQLLEIQVLQLGVAGTGKPGAGELVARGHWQLQLRPN